MLKDLRWFFLLSRPVNLGIAALVFTFACQLSRAWEFEILAEPKFFGSLIALLLVMAGGYWVNDVFDFKIDRINKPDKVIVNSYISSKKALSVYFVSQILTLLASALFLTPLSAFFIFTAAVLLFVYAAWLKRISVAGNLVISTLTAMVIMMAGALYGITMPLIWLTMFAFEITFLREVTKDIEDIRGDLRYKLRTLPIQAGIRGAKWLLIVSGVIFLLSCWLPLIWGIWQGKDLRISYLLFSFFFVQLPTIYVLQLVRKGVKPQDFHRPGLYWKLMIFSGMVSVLFLA